MQQPRFESAPGQESVWDYPRPPRLENVTRHVQVVFNAIVVAETRNTKRVLETSHPPVYYIPPDDVRTEYLILADASSFCEWKGQANYYTIVVGSRQSGEAAWFYPNPTPAFAALQDHVAFYPGRVDACFVDGERVRAQAGGFYGGWITDEIVGPFKGEPGTIGW